MTTDKLQELVVQASTALQELQTALGRAENEACRVRFPRGYLATAETWRQQLVFIKNSTIRNNVAYALMLYDVHSWLLRRTDLAGLARDMVIKAVLANLGSIVEAVLVDHYDGRMGRRQKFVSRTTRLAADGVISQVLKADLDWLWDMRCRQHLQDLTGREFDFYQLTDHDRAAKAMRGLLQALSNAA